LGQNYERFEQIVLLLSEIYDKKYLNDETAQRLTVLIQNMAKDGNFGPQFNVIYQNKLTQQQ
jgi:hypothetical protein